MTKKKHTISKLNTLKTDLQNVISWMEEMFKTNSLIPIDFETKKILIPYLENQKELYENTIKNIEGIICELNNCKEDNDPYSNYIALGSYNIMDIMGSPTEIFESIIS